MLPIIFVFFGTRASRSSASVFVTRSRSFIELKGVVLTERVSIFAKGFEYRMYLSCNPLINGSFVAPAVKIENVNICSDYTLFLGKYYTVETLGIDPLTGFSSSTKLLRKFANTFSFMSQGSLL